MWGFVFLLTAFAVRAFSNTLAASAHDPTQSFDILLRDSFSGFSTYVHSDPISYPPPPPSEYCAQFMPFASDPTRFTFDHWPDNSLRQWIHLSPPGCTNCGGMRYVAAELISTSTNLKHGYFSFVLGLPEGVDISGLWLEFGLSNLGAANAVVWGIVGKAPKKGYTSTTTPSAGQSTIEPDLPSDSRNATPHEYGLLWNADRILWVYDGIVVREETETSKIPPETGNLGMYIDFLPHCGAIWDFWLGNLNEAILPIAVTVHRMRYYPGATNIVPLTPTPGPGPGPPPTPVPQPQPGDLNGSSVSSARTGAAIGTAVSLGIFGAIGLIVAVVVVVLCVALVGRKDPSSGHGLSVEEGTDEVSEIDYSRFRDEDVAESEGPTAKGESEDN